MRKFEQVVLLFTSSLLLHVRADFFSIYFDQKVFGANPGPCPFDDGSCSVDLKDDAIPPSVAEAEFCLIDVLLLSVCDEIQNIVESGLIELWDLQCENIGVETIELEPSQTSSDTIVTKILSENVQQSCRGKSRFTNVVLDVFPLRVLFDLQTDFTTNPSSKGLSISFNLVLQAVGGFDGNLVDVGDVERCRFDANLGLRVQDINYDRLEIQLFIPVLGVDVSGIVQDNLTNLLLILVQTLIGSSICGVLEQAGTLANGDKGVLTVVLDELNEQYDIITAPVNIDVRGTDQAFVSNPESFGSTAEERDDALNLADSNILELVSVTLNDFLGGDDVTPLRINQAIALLTDPAGSVFFDLSELDLNIEVPLSFANASATIERVRANGLDTIDFFQFIQNDFSENGDGLDFTLTHQFGLENFELLISIELRLKRGSWVTASTCGVLGDFDPDCLSDEEVFTFDYGLTVSNVNFSAASLTAINIEEIKGIQIGQLVDHDLTDVVGAAESALFCIAPSVYAFLFSDLQMSIGSISDPFVENFSGEGLDVLIENSVELISILLKNTLTNDLPLIMRGPIRDFVNKVLREEVSDVDDLSQCPPYTQIPSDNPYLVFSQPPFNAFFPILNNVLGNFDADSDVDFNDLVQSVLQYYSINADEFPLVSTGVVGDWDTKPELIPLGELRAFEDDSFMKVRDLKVRNLDTITMFAANEREQFPQGLTFNLEFGGALDNKLEIRLGFEIESSNPAADEDFEFSILLEGFQVATILDEVLVNLDSINRLKIEDLSHVPCLLSVVDGIQADELQSSLSSTNLNFNIVFNNQDSGSTLRDALEELQSEFVNSASNERFTRVVNYFMDVGFNQGLSTLEDLNYSGVPEGCTEIESDFSFVFSIFTGIKSLNFTYFEEECLKKIPPLLPIAEYEKQQLGYVNSIDEIEGDLLKFKENVIIKLLEDFFNIDSSNDSSALENLLFNLANQTGNPIVDLFVFDPENSENVNFELVLNEGNPFLESIGINLSPVVDGNGFKAEAQLLRIKNLNKFLEKLKLFEILSDFILNFEIGFSEGDPLEIELIALIEANSTIIDLAPVGSPPIQEIISIKIPVDGVQIKLQTFTALLMDKFKTLSVAHFLSIDEAQVFSSTEFAFDCLLKSYADGGLNLRSFSVDLSAIGEPSVRSAANNLLSPGVEGLIEEVGKLFIGFYSSALPNICENCIREFINDSLLKQMEKANEPGACPENVTNALLSEENELMRFSDSSLVLSIQQFLQNNMYPDDYRVWNAFIQLATAEVLFDTQPFNTGVFHLLYKGDSYGGLEIELRDVFIENLETFTEVRLFEPVSRDTPDFDEEVDPYKLFLVLDYTGPTAYAWDTTVIGYDFFTIADVVTNEVAVEIELTDFEFGMEMILELNLNTLLKIQFDQVDSLNELPCLLTPIQGFDVVDFNFSTGHVSATARCSGVCDSDLLASAPEFSDDSEELNDAVDTFITFVVQYLESSPAERLINIALETSVETCASIVEGVTNFLDPGPEDANVFSVLLYIFLATMFAGLMVLGYQYPRHQKRRQLIMKRFEEDPDKEFNLGAEQQILSNELDPLVSSPAVPPKIKYILPFICCINVIAVTVGVLSQGALTITVQTVILGLEMNVIDLVPLTVISIVNQMWAAGAWQQPIAIILVAASFVWPIINNGLLVFLWCTPTTIVSHQQRARLLEILNIGARWSLLDVFVIVVTLAAVSTYVELSQQEDLQFLDPEVFSLNASARLEAGIILLALTAFSTLIVNHIMSYFHRKTLDNYRKQYDEIAGNAKIPRKASSKKRISGYKFSKRMICPKKMNYLFGLHVSSVLLLLLGMILPLCTFEIRGLAGLALGELDESQTSRTFSIFSLGGAISKERTGSAEDLVIIFFQFMFFLVAVIAPLAQFIMLSFLLKAKFSLRNLTIFMESGMVLSYWAALDVVIIGVIGTMIELEAVTKFVVDFVTNDLCSNIKGTIEIFVPDEEDASCLTVVGSLQIGALPLILGIGGQLVVLAVSMILAFRVVQDRYFFAYISSGLRPRNARPTKMGYLRTLVYKTFTTPLTEELLRARSKQDSAGGFNAAGNVRTINPRFRASRAGESSVGEEVDENLPPDDKPNISEEPDIFDQMGDMPNGGTTPDRKGTASGSVISSFFGGKRLEF